MGWLTGKEVAHQVEMGRISIDPFDTTQCNPNSYDYRLAPVLKVLEANSVFNGTPCLDPKLPPKYHEVSIPESGLLLEVEQAYLGRSIERFTSRHYAALTTGKSSVGRLFVKNHLFHLSLVPLGFDGHLALQISAKLPTLIFPNMRIGQVFWFESSTSALIEKAGAA